MREDDLGGGPALLVEERVLAVSSAHLLSARDSVSLEDLADVPLLTIEGELPDYWLEQHVPSRTPGERLIARGPVVTNMQEALMLVAGGRGALLAAVHTATYSPRPGVAYLPFVDAEPIEYGLVWRTGTTPARWMPSPAQHAGWPARWRWETRGPRYRPDKPSPTPMTAATLRLLDVGTKSHTLPPTHHENPQVSHPPPDPSRPARPLQAPHTDAHPLPCFLVSR